MMTVGARSAVGAGTLGRAVAPDTSPYPWPWDERFDIDRLALVVLVGTEPAAPPSDPVWTVVAGLIDAVGNAGGLIVEISTRRPPGRGMHTWTESTVSRLGGDVQLSAPGWDGFFNTPLDSVLRSSGRDLLLLAGSWLETGVHSTMRSANDRGYECLLLTDACISDGPATSPGAISSVEMSGGIFGAIGTCADALSLLHSSNRLEQSHERTSRF